MSALAPRPVMIAVLLTLGAVLAGCIGGDDADKDLTAPTDALVPVDQRHLLPYVSTEKYSRTLNAGLYDILAGLPVDVPVALDLTEGGNAVTSDATVHLGLFLPEIPGCDWTAAELPDQCHVPVVADVGPYYSSTKGVPDAQTEGDSIAEEPANRLGGFLIENLVPHGYAVAQVSVFGTGDSTHCMDLMGPAEQAGVVAAVEWLGSQPWSNGAVGLIGRSYDGSTPWEAAMHGPEALKTIVPISGLTGQHDLMWYNGSAEFRGPGLLYGLYAAMTIDGEPGDAQQVLCPDYLTGGPQGAGAWLTGDRFAEAANPYWGERRFFDETLANYDGSVYFIHGLQDWNVDSHMAFPYYQQLIDNGYEVKGLFGQWGHMYPDRPSEHVNLGEGRGAEASRFSPRFDWAQDLLEWFDHYLKGTGPKPQLHVEVQDNVGQWRFEETYPPQDATWMQVPMSDMTAEHTTPDVLAGAPFLGTDQLGTRLRYVLPAFEEDTHIAGNVRFHVTVTPTGPGGQIYAVLQDAKTGMHYGHSIMDLRFADGSDEMTPVVPGMPLVAKMEFWAIDAPIPAGTVLALELAVTGDDYLPPSVNDPVLVDTSAASVLKVPTVERGDESYFSPVAWEPCSYGPFLKRAADDTDGRFAARVNDLYGCDL